MIRCSFGSKVQDVTDLSLFHMEMISTQIARQAALLSLEIVEVEPTSQYFFFKQMLEGKHRIASLLLSDAADLGVSIVRNAKINLKKPHRRLLDLKGAFAGIPAVIVGAGPSLEDNGHLLPDNAIIFAGGHALKKIQKVPHFGALIDKNPLEFPNLGFPLCIQPRAHPIDGNILMAPDSHFPLMDETFNGGWTVGNFMAAVAVHFGCNPIICVGMDYCARAGKKYAFDEMRGDTQEDWLASVAWLEHLAENNPQITFLNASNGVKYFTPCKLEDCSFEKKPLDQIIQNAIAKLEVHIAEFQEERMLAPLWQIWEPVFARSGNFSEEQMNLHKELFFQKMSTR